MGDPLPDDAPETLLEVCVQPNVVPEILALNGMETVCPLNNDLFDAVAVGKGFTVTGTDTDVEQLFAVADTVYVAV